MNRGHTVAMALLCVLTACGRPAPAPMPPDVIPASAAPAIPGPIQPLPTALQLDPGRVELGRRLYLDPRLSHDNSIACANCHPLERYGADGLPVSLGIEGRKGSMNAPTVFNSGFNFRQFWDGRAASLEEQAGGPLENPLEMGSSWPEVLGKLEKDTQLQDLSLRTYGRRLDESVIRSAIATFERSLVTPDSPFDRFLKGEEAALSPQAKEGWKLFRRLGCVSCHQGANMGGNMYATLGVMHDHFASRNESRSDQGLFNRTGREEDRHKFKVPSLRNVAMTAPYFHDGSQITLEAAVTTMARDQLGITLAEQEIEALLAFLNSLTGQPPAGTP